MSKTYAAPGTPTAGKLRPAGNMAHTDRRFFGGMVIVLLLTVIGGFSRTYYFNSLVATPFALTGLLHWHGVLFSAWMLLLVAQTRLIAVRRPDLHRRMGYVGAALAVAMVVLATTVAITRTAAGVTVDRGVPPLVFMAVPLVGMVVFAALFGAALHVRRRGAAHKRLVILASLEIVTAAVARLPIVETWGPPGFFGVIDLFLVAIAFYDWRTLGRLHPATLWGGLFLIASQVGRLLLGGTAMWLSFAGWLTS
jgi:hypothetical protein